MTEITQAELQQKQTWKLTLAYDGTDFHGWQVQPEKRTVQGELQAALGRLVGEAPLPQGSGRTDAGVHALAQVASFELQARIPATNLVRALNRTLPGSIGVLDAAVVPDSFHARHSAVAKTYEYRVLPIEPAADQICSPFLARYVYPYSWRVNLDLLQRAAAALVGEHDFRSFAASDPDLATRAGVEGAGEAVATEPRTVRTIFASEWREETRDGFRLLIYRVRGNGFLHHMVRNLVGTTLDVGRGYLGLEEIPRILGARDRAAAGPTAPARGLFLHSVEYSMMFRETEFSSNHGASVSY
ncbi:tRNA pseudouridine(38-40) synthase TruA [Occallatibacter savannae]|uniref:tRNA pseudouridine(38-40) synthase TruA n=1 Tax=Occallatibacter savannae TaxID=1002691 RepID=UPI001EF71030|nr:tRNA pseudouridine(38-40) synthase TruA [Occallatibacter savannae]